MLGDNAVLLVLCRNFFSPSTLGFCMDDTLGLGDLQHSGDITHLFSAARGCKRSGDKARRSSGDPGSALFGREKLFFFMFGLMPEALVPTPALPPACEKLLLLAGNAEPGLYDCVVLDAPG